MALESGGSGSRVVIVGGRERVGKGPVALRVVVLGVVD